MKVGIIVQARMGSTRLPGKVLRKLGSKTLLEHLMIRLSRCKSTRNVVIATTTNPVDGAISAMAERMGFAVFFGSEEDALDRYYQAAKGASLDVVVRVTADCPLLDPRIVDQMVEEFIERKVDFLSNSEPIPSTWPDGMDVSVFTFSALEKAWREARLPSNREHVTFYFWQSGNFRAAKSDLEQDWSDFRFTVDYQEDLDFLEQLSAVALRLYGSDVSQLTMEQLVKAVEFRPELKKLNSQFKRGQGWAPSIEADRLYKHDVME